MPGKIRQINVISRKFQKSWNLMLLIPQLCCVSYVYLPNHVEILLLDHFLGCIDIANPSGLNFVIPRGFAPWDENWVPRDWQYQCIPRNDRAIIYCLECDCNCTKPKSKSICCKVVYMEFEMAVFNFPLQLQQSVFLTKRGVDKKCIEFQYYLLIFNEVILSPIKMGLFCRALLTLQHFGHLPLSFWK